MLIAKIEGKRIEARRAEKGLKYICPNCSSEVILKKGRIVKHHFAHKPKITCAWRIGETLQHLKAKELFRDEFLSRGLSADLEHIVPSLPKDKRADVLVWSKIGNRFAIELQHTAIDYENLEERTICYINAKVAVIWIPFLKAEYIDRAKPIEFGKEGDLLIEKFPARPLEKWVQGLYFGEPWLYDPTSEDLYMYKLKRHLLYKEYTEWYDEEGEEHSDGGYNYPSRRWKNLVLFGPYQINQVRIDVLKRPKKSIGNHNYPGGYIGKLVPTDAK